MLVSGQKLISVVWKKEKESDQTLETLESEIDPAPQLSSAS